MNEATIDNLYERQFLSELDYRFARFIGRLDGTNDALLLLAASLVSRYRGDGHICIDLAELSGKPIELGESGPRTCPPLKDWLKALEKSPVVGSPGDVKPLILDGARLYLFRYWDYETGLAHALKNMTNARIETFDEPKLKNCVDRIFPRTNDDEKKEMDWQKVAAFSSLRNRLCVISGGPGTGKTFTVAKILALLVEQSGNDTLNIALTAPTGKAAARLQEAIKEAKATLNCSDAVKAAIPEEASTLHRLLKTIPYSPYFRFNVDNPLPYDVVVIDEASMVDLALFSKLTQALRPQSRLILLGDKDQLASVEAGSVLGDICDTGNVHRFSQAFIDVCRRVTGENFTENHSGPTSESISDCIVQFTRSYRFHETSGIHAVSRAVNAGEDDNTLDLIKKGTYGDIHWRNLPRPNELLRYLEDWITGRYDVYLKAADPLKALDHFSRSRILTALREGPYGVHNLNFMIERIMHKKGLIERIGRWYSGRPVMITRNDYNLRLFNGDIGIAMETDGRDGELRVFFPGTEGPLRSFPPLRLPDHETVYAMTVHKSQGSEFDEVLFITPDRDTQVMTRELIYTAVTRAKKKIQVWGKEDVFLTAIQRRIHRSSGLREALWGDRTL
ncbi:MAG: exodeoxyribonuclease V subunit alpha [Deltaproteobacteria bacterium]|nr:exodeoxyribonuclease V subunit alpha [Deltaproteobacteria bacterium]